jgi:DNA-binding MurR/RpiR family transcriptional regulator
VLAITASGSPLAKLADVLLTLNHPEGNLNFVPMIVRLLQLMMLDILSVGWRGAIRRNAPARPNWKRDNCTACASAAS